MGIASTPGMHAPLVYEKTTVFRHPYSGVLWLNTIGKSEWYSQLPQC